MPHVVKLHTRSDRKYRGKYPTRHHSFSNGGIEAPIVARHLDMRSPHFVELNNGDRFYIDGFYLSTFDVPIHATLRAKYDWAAATANPAPLDIHAYHRMLKEINEARKARLEVNLAHAAARKAAR